MSCRLSVAFGTLVNRRPLEYSGILIVPAVNIEAGLDFISVRSVYVNWWHSSGEKRGLNSVYSVYVLARTMFTVYN